MPFPPSRGKMEKPRADSGPGINGSSEKGSVPVTEDAQEIIVALEPSIRVDAEAFREELPVELEHGREFMESNVTNNYPILTGKIVLAHLLEYIDYYTRLEMAEWESEAMKAIAANDWASVKRIAESRLA